mgnify:CR=1 FL=1
MFFFLQVAYALAAQMCKMSTQEYDLGKLYLPISIILPEILDQFQAVALIQMDARHSNVRRSLCNVLSHTHQKQLECGGNESAGVLNSTVHVVPLPVCMSARGTIYSTRCHRKLSPNTLPGQVRKWYNFSQKTGNTDVISVPTPVTLTPTCLKANCMLDTSVTI